MENKTRTKVIFAIVVIVLIVCGFVIFRECVNQKKEEVAAETHSIDRKKIDLDQTKIWKDKYNKVHYENERLRADQAAVQASSDSLAKLLKIKTKQIEGFSFVKSGLEAKLKLQKEIIYDTIREPNTGEINVLAYQKFSFKNKWIDIKGDLGKSDSLYVKTIDTLTRVDYWKRNWFLGKKRYFSDFSTKNPYISIQGLKNVETTHPDQRWSIGPYIGVDFRYDQRVIVRPSIGVSLQYAIFKF